MLAPRVELRTTPEIAPILKQRQMFGKMLRALIYSIQKAQGVASGD